MNILRIVAKSFSESVQLCRFLPFFLLYLVLLFTAAIFMIPIIKISPSIFTSDISKIISGAVAINLMPILIVLTIVIFANLWFVGALVYNIQTGKNFDESLKYSSSIYWHLLAFSLFAIIFTLLTYFAQFGLIFGLIFDIIFFVSIPAIIMEKNFLKGIKSSFDLMKKRFLQTVLIWIVVSVINLILFFALLFSIASIFAPLLANFFTMNPYMNTSKAFSTEQYVQLAGFILNNYHYVFLSCIISAFFFSVMAVFTYTSKTYFFLSISKKTFKFS